MNKYHEKEKDYVSKKLIEECIDEMKPSNCFGKLKYDQKR